MSFESWWAKYRDDHCLKPSSEHFAGEIWNAATTAERKACAEIAETDSILDWVGGSTGNAKGTAMRIAKAIRERSA